MGLLHWKMKRRNNTMRLVHWTTRCKGNVRRSKSRCFYLCQCGVAPPNQIVDAAELSGCVIDDLLLQPQFAVKK